MALHATTRDNTFPSSADCCVQRSRELLLFWATLDENKKPRKQYQESEEINNLDKGFCNRKIPRPVTVFVDC